MKELFLEKPLSLKLREVPSLPAPKSTEVKMKVSFAGICGSDIHIYKGGVSYAPYPMRPGHEVIGVVGEVGEKASLKVGTRVALEPNGVCGECEWCRQGRVNICKTRIAWGINDPNGCFGEEFLCEERYLVPIPDALPDERAILVEPLAVAVHVLGRTKVTADTSLAVVGCGTIGLFGIALASLFGAKITAIDASSEKLALAKRIDGTITAMRPEDVKDEMFDVVMESAGAKPAIEMAFQLVKPGGALIEVGITGQQVDYPLVRVVRNEITIFGSISYTMEDFKKSMAYLLDPKLNVGPILSKIYPLSSFGEAFDDALSGKCAKILLKF